MRIGVISDTHGHMGFTSAAVELLRERNVEVVLHCGDIGTPDVVGLFVDWPTHFVLGNTDYDAESIRDAAEENGMHFHGRFADLTLAGRRIAVLHGDDHRRFYETVSGGEYDLVCYGHTHQAEHHLEGKTLVLNPGALYRADPHSFAVVDLGEMEVSTVIVGGC
jgi:putative phosphoesterase